MKTTFYKCDRCEADITGAPRSHLKPSAGAAQDRLPEGLDLCPDCIESLMAWLDGPGADASGTGLVVPRNPTYNDCKRQQPTT